MNPINVLFSAKTLGVYSPAINSTDIPDDVLEVPETYWISLLKQLAVTAKIIGVHSINGYPIWWIHHLHRQQKQPALSVAGVPHSWLRPTVWWRETAMNWKKAAVPR